MKMERDVELKISGTVCKVRETNQHQLLRILQYLLLLLVIVTMYVSHIYTLRSLTQKLMAERNTLQEISVQLCRRVDELGTMVRRLTDIYEYQPEVTHFEVIGRDKRSAHRGGRRQKHRRKPHYNVAAQFKANDPGALTTIHVEGVLGPWFPDVGNDIRNLKMMGVKLVDANRKVQISRKGVYLIYCQVTFLTNRILNSYSINVVSATDKSNTSIAICSKIGAAGAEEAETSCSMSVVRRLSAGDQVYIQQLDRNRSIIFYEGYSFFGLVMLNGN